MRSLSTKPVPQCSKISVNHLDNYMSKLPCWASTRFVPRTSVSLHIPCLRQASLDCLVLLTLLQCEAQDHTCQNKPGNLVGERPLVACQSSMALRVGCRQQPRGERSGDA